MGTEKHEVFTCARCGAQERIEEEDLRALIRRNPELVQEQTMAGRLPAPRGRVRVVQGQAKDDGSPPPIYATRA